MKLTSSKSTALRYRYVLENFLYRHRDKPLPEQYGRWDIVDFKEMRLREGINPATVNLELSILRAFWNWLIERELASVNPASRQKYLTVPEKRPRGLGREAIEKLLSVCYSVRDKLIILLPLTTGMRGVEMARLQWSDIDWENNLIHLDGERTKTKGSRTLPLRADVKELLLRFKDERRKNVFPCHRGQGDPRTLQLHFNRIVKRAELNPRPTLHALRHTFATMLLRTGLDIYSVQKLMGHTQLKTTTRYLAPADSTTVREAVDSFPTLA